MDFTNRRLLLQLHTTALLVGAVVERQLGQVGIPAYLFGLLSHIRANEPVTPSEIAAATGTPATTLRDNIQRLVDRGLVRRTSNPDDGRSYLVRLTRKGEVMARAADPLLLAVYLELEKRLGRPLADYEATLDEIAAALRAVLEAQPEAVTVPPRRRVR